MLRACVFQDWGLGDLVMTVPVLATLRSLYPDSDITLLVRGKPQLALLEGSPLADRVLELPRKGSRWRTLAFFLGLRRYRLDVAFVGTRLPPVVAYYLRFLAGARTIIGDGPSHGWLYTHRNRIDPAVHRVDRMLETLSLWTGKPPGRASFPLPVATRDARDVDGFMLARGIAPGRFLALHPGSSLAGKDRRIPLATAKAVIERVRADYPWCAIAILCGPEDFELAPFFETVADATPGVVVAKEFSLGMTKALLTRAACFVGTDSALGHIASAFEIPVVTLFGPAVPSETRPYPKDARVVMRAERLPCQPCWGTPLQGRCPNNLQCMTDITIESVFSPIAAILDRVAGSPDSNPA